MARNGLSGTLTSASSIRVSDDNINKPNNTVNHPVSQAYSFGTAAGQANVISSEQYVIAPSGTQTLILDDSSLTDQFGNISNFTNIKGIRIQHSPDSTASGTTVGGTFTVAFTAGTDQLAIPLAPGGFFDFSDNQVNLAVGAGQTITITNNDAVDSAIITVDLLGT